MSCKGVFILRKVSKIPEEQALKLWDRMTGLWSLPIATGVRIHLTLECLYIALHHKMAHWKIQDFILKFSKSKIQFTNYQHDSICIFKSSFIYSSCNKTEIQIILDNTITCLELVGHLDNGFINIHLFPKSVPQFRWPKNSRHVIVLSKIIWISTGQSTPQHRCSLLFYE